ncbi:MAG TPA: iron-sulfur cluster assembly scaffold protein, partial [Pirellulales bacterium]|nr:iron-sulfur cluster assembly scaffold protein [Pirellulales bacterium]
PACGDVVHIELTIEDNIIHHAYFTGVGCRISQAAASMLVEHVESRPLSDIKLFSAADMLTVFGPPLMPLRQRCCLLAWQALQQAIYSPVAVSSSNL